MDMICCEIFWKGDGADFVFSRRLGTKNILGACQHDSRLKATP